MNSLALTVSGAKRWHKEGYTGKGVTIAVLDNFETDKIISPYNPNLSTSHGLNVCKSVLVTAPDANVMMLKWKGRGGDKKKCIEWIKNNKPDIINVSLGGMLIQARDFEELEGYTLICATGNDSKDVPLYPARYDFTLAVGSWNHNLNRVAIYSNRGEDVFGLNPYIQNSEGNWWAPMGTSFAAPFASGLAACYVQLLKEHDIEPTRDSIYDFAKTNRNEYGLFVLPETIPQIDPPQEKKEERPLQQKKVIEMYIDNDTAYVDSKPVKLLTPPRLFNQRTHLGVRDLANLLGCQIAWNQKEKKITIIQ